jgi:hypothetical protein
MSSASVARAGSQRIAGTRFLDEMEKCGFFDQLWVRQAIGNGEELPRASNPSDERRMGRA